MLMASWSESHLDGARTWWRGALYAKRPALAGSGSMPLMASIGRTKPQALLLTSAGMGALLVFASWRRLVFKLLRPAVLSSLVFQIVKAGDCVGAHRKRLNPPGSKAS